MMKDNRERSHEVPDPEQELQVFSLAEVQNLVKQDYEVIPLVEKIELKESPGAVYERLRGNGPSFMLESAESAEQRGRYSFIGIDPDLVIRLEKDGMMVNGEAQEFTDPYDFVDKLICGRKVAPVSGLPTFFGGAAGLFGYDLARYREPTIGKAKEDKLDLPELALMVPGVTIAFDFESGKEEVSIIKNILVPPGLDEAGVAAIYDEAVQSVRSVKQQIVSPTDAGEQPRTSYDPLSFSSNMTPEAYKAAVQSAKESAEAGDTFQIVPSQRFSSKETVDSDFALEVFKKLKPANPSRYGFLFEFEDFQATGCSPETLVKVTNGQVEHMAIAGTRKRGKTPEEDAALAKDLQNDPKEIAEHSMLVDLSRNDVNRVCEAESVRVEIHAEVEKYSHVIHLTSKIVGLLRKGKSALDALGSIAPAGTLSGAPKISAMQEIDKLEPDKRGFYGGAVGYLNYNGDLDSCIFIRSTLVDKQGHVHVQAGAGVVADSDPTKEYEETVMKARAPMHAIEEVCASSDQEDEHEEAVISTQGHAEVYVPKFEHQELSAEGIILPRKPQKRARRLGSTVLLLDNYDSYTHNVRQYLEQLGADVVVLRNDVAEREMIQVNPDFLVVSPGPHTPNEAGLSMKAMSYFPEKGVPSLGICLGHQALIMAFGGEVGHHKAVHGKASEITHDGKTILKDLSMPLKVQRYHSLVGYEPLPAELERSAYVFEDDQELIMAVRHTEMPAEGVQFHPESYYTPYGMKMLENFLTRAE